MRWSPRSSARRRAEAMAETLTPESAAPPAMLELRAIEARYGAATALRDVSMAIAAGELVCVVGPNGAGKTTLINVIAGIHRAAAGAIVLDGTDLARWPAHRFCDAGIALVPEGRRLFTTMTVRENLELGSYRS